MRVIEINLHIHRDGCLVAILERKWGKYSHQRQVLQRFHLPEHGQGSEPAAILRAVAAAIAPDEADGH